MRVELVLLSLILIVGCANAMSVNVRTIPAKPSVGDFVVVVEVSSPYPVKNANMMLTGLIDGSVSLGDFTGNVSTEFKVHVDRAGTYGLEVFLSYTTESNGSEYLRCVKQITVLDKPEFEIKDVRGCVEPGERGTITLKVENVGGDAKNVRIGLEGVRAKDSERFYGLWRGGDVKVLNFTVFVDENASVGEKGVELLVKCTDPYGNTYRYTIPFTITITGKPELVPHVVVPKVYPDENFTLKLTVENVGKKEARNVVVRLKLPEGFSGDSVAYLGEIGRGESREASFHLKVGRNVTGNRTVGVEMSCDGYEWRYEIPIYVFPLEPMRIDVSGVYTIPNRLVEGETFTLNLAVENSGKEVAKGVKIKLELPRGLVGRDTYFVGTLASGDSATSTFVLKAEGHGRFVVRAVVTYLDPTLKEHVEYENFTLYVFPSQNNVPIVALVLVILIGVGFWLWRRS